MTIKPNRRSWILPEQLLTCLYPGQRVAFTSEIDGLHVNLCGFVNANGRVEDTKGNIHPYVVEITTIPLEHERGDWTPEHWTERGVLPPVPPTPAVLVITDPETGQKWRITAPFNNDADRYNKQLFLLYTRRAWRSGIGRQKIEAEYE